MHGTSLEDCRQRCLNDRNCNHISYFNTNAKPVKRLCRLLKSCEERIAFLNSVSEGRECFEDCGDSNTGPLDDNVLDLITNIERREECKQLCVNDEQCSFYTYFFKTDPIFQQHCFLQTISPNIYHRTHCDHCVSAPVNCSIQEEDYSVDVFDVLSYY